MSDEPRDAWINTKDGERVACLLEEVEPLKWQATPVRDVRIEDVQSVDIDVLPAQSSVSFLFVGEEE